jgi:hypothetical protein
MGMKTEIRGENYLATYNPATSTIALQGVLRLRGAAEYGPIVQLLDDVISAAPKTITLDLQNLTFLNSSGINVLFKFVIKMREQENSQLIVHGTTEVPWQDKSLKNLQRLMPTLHLKLT